MTLVVEDGTGLENASSYVSLAAAGAYNGAREPNRAVWLQHDNVELEAALIDAQRALDAMFGWRGSIRFDAQRLKWPRNHVQDDDGRLIPNDAVPQVVADAQAQLAYRLLEERGSLPGGVLGPGAAKSERFGDYSVEYLDMKIRDWPELSRMLRGLTDSGPSASGFGQQKRVRWS